MAGETRGKALEALVVAATELHQAGISESLVWDTAVEGLRWKPDLFVVRTDWNPGLVVWITYAGSENDSQQKGWRNLAELIDVRTALGIDVRCVGVLAGGRTRAKFLQLQKLLFSECVELEQFFSVATVNRLLDHATEGSAKSEERVQRIITLASSDKVAADGLRKLGCALFGSDTTPSVECDFWVPLKTHVRTCKLRDTSYRRGIAKAALLQPADLICLSDGHGVPFHARHEALVSAGILVRSIKGVVLRDKEINFAIENVDRLSELIEANITTVGRSSRERVSQIGLMQGALSWLADNWNQALTPRRLDQLLIGNNDNAPKPQYVLQAVKAALSLRKGQQGQAWLEDVEDRSGIIKSVLIGLVLPKFERGEANLPTEVRAAVAHALAVRMADVKKLTQQELPSAISGLIQKEIENRMVCHGLDGVGALLKRVLQENGVQFGAARLVSGLSERLGYSARDFSLSNGIVTKTGVFFHWRTVTRQGRDHKVKELGARAYQGRKSWNGKCWCTRNVPHTTCLVIDGEWDSDGVEFLAQTGWDAIARPDEVEALVTLAKRSRG